jgi:hypothetical protein
VFEDAAKVYKDIKRGTENKEGEAFIRLICDEAVFSRMIPFQESPLDLHSLAELTVKATGVGIGAYAGFVASGGTPLVLITVPLGMVLVGAAAGLGRALEEGLRKRILSLMGVPDSQNKKAQRKEGAKREEVNRR